MIERYQTEAMTAIWNEEAKFERWTQVEVAATEAFHSRGEVPDQEMADIREKAHHQSAERVKEHRATVYRRDGSPMFPRRVVCIDDGALARL